MHFQSFSSGHPFLCSFLSSLSSVLCPLSHVSVVCTLSPSYLPCLPLCSLSSVLCTLSHASVSCLSPLSPVLHLLSPVHFPLSHITFPVLCTLSYVVCLLPSLLCPLSPKRINMHRTYANISSLQDV